MNQTDHKMKFTILISLAAAIGGFLFGFDLGVIGGALSGLRDAFQSDSFGNGFNVTSMILGCAAGALIAGRLSDRFGRKKILLYAAGFFTVSAWGSGMANSPAPFAFYRFLGGLAVGAVSVLVPVYISETAPARYRGRLLSMQQIAILSGLFSCFISNYLIAGRAGGPAEVFAWGFQAWRWMFWMELIPAVTFFFALRFIPESPRFLASCGRKTEAVEVLGRIMEEEEAQIKMREMEQSFSSGPRPSLRDGAGLFGLRPIVWTGIILASFQQFTGIHILFYYRSALWQSVGLTESHSVLITVMMTAFSLTSCAAAILLIDRIGRRPLLLIGSVGMALTLATMAVVFGIVAAGANGMRFPEDGSGLAPALFAAILYGVFFNFSWGPLTWAMLGEMFPGPGRGSATGLSACCLWVSKFVILMTFPAMLAGIGAGWSYMLYAVFAVISFFFVLKFVRETKGIELEEMKG